MNAPWRRTLIISYAFLALSLRSAGIEAAVIGTNGAVATVHPLATDAAANAVRHGGNAVDAAVAAALTLGVVDGHNSGIGGGCFFLVRTERGSVVAIDGRETAPAKASRDMFLRDGKALAELSLAGALSIGVPGSLAVYDYALKHFGKLTLRDHLLPAAALARRGFPIDASYAAKLAECAKELARFAESRRVLLQRDGRPYRAGHVLLQPELAESYEAIARDGIDWFYKGEFPVKVEQWMRQNGGLMVADDFRHYQIKLREPIRSRYRAYEIIGFPAPSSGGVHVAQILNILEHLDLRPHVAYSADAVHLIAEAMKLAFADRAFWLGDPEFVRVPRGLVSREYARSLASRITLQNAIEVPRHGDAHEHGTDAFGKHTTHFSTADAEGNWVACTATVNTSFGSKVIIPGTGVIMNNQMDDFSAQPGVANYFGLVGAEANAVQPRKRPLSSMSPTIVLEGGRPILSLGAAGGPTIISQTVVTLINLLEYKMPLDEALRSPRLHHQWKPDELRAEPLTETVEQNLIRRGQNLVTIRGSGAAQVVKKSGAGFEAAYDPRLKGKAAVW